MIDIALESIIISHRRLKTMAINRSITPIPGIFIRKNKDITEKIGICKCKILIYIIGKGGVNHG